jgi:hypothetical protein
MSVQKGWWFSHHPFLLWQSVRRIRAGMGLMKWVEEEI